MMVTTTTRHTAEERREAVLEAANVEFAMLGYHGASTDAIARRAGISQPYLFRLFGSKKDLYVACVSRCMRETLERFQRAAEGLRGQEALDAMGMAYSEQLESDQIMLRAQLHSYAAASGDPEIAAAVRDGWGDLYTYVERVSGLPPTAIARFFAKGMLINLFAATGIGALDEDWARRFAQGCRESVST